MDLGSDVGGDEDPVEEGDDSQVNSLRFPCGFLNEPLVNIYSFYFQSLIPSSQAVSGEKRQGSIESTPRKKKTASAPASKSGAVTSTAIMAGIEVEGGSLFGADTSQIPCGNNKSPSPQASITPRSSKSPKRPALRLNTPTPPIPPGALEAVAKIYGPPPTAKEPAQNPGPSTAELMRDPFIGVKPGLPFSKKKLPAKVHSFRKDSVLFPRKKKKLVAALPNFLHG